MEFDYSWIIIVVASIIGLWIILYFIPIGLWFTALLVRGANLSACS